MLRIVVLLISSFLLMPSAMADARYEKFLLLAERDRNLSLDKAVSKTKKRYGGRVLSAEEAKKGGNSEYRIRMLTDEGRVRRYRVDPRSGDVLPKKKHR